MDGSRPRLSTCGADIGLFRGRTGQYVFISSASAYQTPPARVPILESTPLRNPFLQYSRDKIACEIVAWYGEDPRPAAGRRGDGQAGRDPPAALNPPSPPSGEARHGLMLPGQGAVPSSLGTAERSAAVIAVTAGWLPAPLR